MSRLSPALQQATPLTITRGEGTWVFDKDEKPYLDATAGIGVTSTGHCHPRIVAAAKAQLDRLIHGQYAVYRHDRLTELVDALGVVLPSRLTDQFFANSGAEAVEAAVRLARNATSRQNVIVFHGSFHGRTLGASAMTTSGTRFRSVGSGPLPGGVVVAPFPAAFRYGWTQSEAERFALQELDHIFATLTSPQDVAAMIVEPVLGEAGYLPASTPFLQGLRERADRHQMLLIFDEVQSGVGRTGRFWAHEHFDVEPDILTFAKGIGSGFPISGIAAPHSIMKKAHRGSQGGTFSANPVACAAVIETLAVIAEENLLANASRMGKRLDSGLRSLAQRFPIMADVRGLGLMLAVELADTRGQPMPEFTRNVLAAMLEHGVIMLPCGPYSSIIRMIPALTVNESEIDLMLNAWENALSVSTH